MLQQTLTFDGVCWHVVEKFSSQTNPSFYCSGEDGVVWVSGLLLSVRRIEVFVVPFIHDHRLVLQHDHARLHGSVHNSWNLKKFLLLHAQHTHPHRSPVRMHVWDAFEEERTNIPQAIINKPITSMRRRVAQREANGGRSVDNI